MMRNIRKAIDMYQNKPLINCTRLLTTDACQAILYVYLFKRSIYLFKFKNIKKLLISWGI